VTSLEALERDVVDEPPDRRAPDEHAPNTHIASASPTTRPASCTHHVYPEANLRLNLPQRRLPQCAPAGDRRHQGAGFGDTCSGILGASIVAMSCGKEVRTSALDTAPRGDAIRRIARDDARVTDPSTSAVAAVFARAATPRSASRSSFGTGNPSRVAGGQNRARRRVSSSRPGSSTGRRTFRPKHRWCAAGRSSPSPSAEQLRIP
jgi:hypothetical protein